MILLLVPLLIGAVLGCFWVLARKIQRLPSPTVRIDEPHTITGQGTSTVHHYD